MGDLAKLFTDIGGYLKIAFDTLKDWYSIANDYVNAVNPALGGLTHIIVWLAIIGIFASLVFSIIHGVRAWKPKQDSHLMYSYFCGTGRYQWGLIYKEAYTRLYDHKWWKISFAGIAYYIGNITLSSKVLSFALSLAYVPLTILGFLEMLVRDVVGTILLGLLAIVHWLAIFVLNIVALLLMPIYKIIDNVNRNYQHCSKCYYEFSLPEYICPHCGVKHSDLVPSNTGAIFARCECGKFISSFIFSGKSKYKAACPKCGEILGASNAKQFAVQLVGGNDTGKTAFLAALQHLVLNSKMSKHGAILGHPSEAFGLLEQAYQSGETESSSATEVGVTTFIYDDGKSVKQNSMVFYDIPDEVILSDSYENNPLNFGYSNGIILMIDPLNLENVRQKLKSNGNESALIGSSEDDPEELIIDFINQYSKIVGRSANKMVSTPLAVIINKSDVDIVSNEIGEHIVKKVFESNPQRYNNSIVNAMSSVCRSYLEKNGMTNAINNLESTFSNICYFSVSAMGHQSQAGISFKPNGVIEPILWLTRKENAKLQKLFESLCDNYSTVKGV